MKKLLTFILISLATILSAQNNPIKHVIVIGVDGMSPDGILHAEAPNLDSLMAQGSSTFECKAQMPTVSSPNWSSIIDGAPPAAHGVWSNKWQPRQIRDSVYCGGKKGRIFPTIFRVLRDQNRRAKIVCFAAWWSFVRLVEPGVCNSKDRTFYTHFTGLRTANAIKIRKPDLLFVHFTEVDEMGHKYGHGTAKYYATISKVDKEIGHIMKAIKKAHIENSTIVMIIADHGGLGHGHGGNTPAEINVPYIIMGPGIKKGYRLKSTPRNYDTTATLAKIMRLKTPDCWEGVCIDEIFDKPQ